MSENTNVCNVRVAVRIRPLIEKEILEGSNKCLDSNELTKEISISTRNFNFDIVLNENSSHEIVYEKCAKEFVKSCLEGYNATILAYGQTGSGKTFTMGSSHLYQEGIIPFAIDELFSLIEEQKSQKEFIIKVSFLEIYNEEIFDLLENPINIREEKDGSINVYGITEEKVKNTQELFACLESGSLHRSTGSTLMNASSSRSHAIFSIFVEQHTINDPDTENGEEGYIASKFHFVDLAGSERLKKTGAEGATMKEGISINKGLLALGNVIAALTETNNRNHVPYRDSKLTRMLQDSLGGNAKTLFIACVSPADSNIEETLSTLKYASRARHIKNKPIINRDPQSALISQLQQQVFELNNNLLRCKGFIKERGLMEEFIAVKKDSLEFDFPEETPKNLNENRQAKLNIEREIRRAKDESLVFKKEVNNTNILLIKTQENLNNVESLKTQLENLINSGENLKEIREKWSEIVENSKQNEKNSPRKKKSKLSTVLASVNMMEKDRQYKELQNEFERILKDSANEQKLLIERTKEKNALEKKIVKLELQLQLQFLEIDKYKIETKENEKDKKDDSLVEIGEGSQDNSDNDNKDNNDIKENNEELLDILEKNDENLEILQKKKEIETDEKEFVSKNKATESLLNIVANKLETKEKQLDSMNEEELELQRKLMETMQCQYDLKIIKLEEELLELKKSEKEEKPEKKERMTIVNDEIKDLRKKAKEQEILQKRLEETKSRVGQLGDEIKRIKGQKINLLKKLKEENEKFDKMRNEKEKILQSMQRENRLKDKKLSKLIQELEKRDAKLKDQATQLSEKAKLDLLFDRLTFSSNKKKNKKVLNRKEGQKLIEKASSEKITSKEIEDIIQFLNKELERGLDIRIRLKKEFEGLKEARKELENMQKIYAEMENGFGNRIEEVRERVESMEIDLEFREKRYADLNCRAKAHSFWMLETHLKKIDGITLQSILEGLLSILAERILEGLYSKEKIKMLESEIKVIKIKIDIVENQKRTSLNSGNKLQLIRNEIKKKKFIAEEDEINNSMPHALELEKRTSFNNKKLKNLMENEVYNSDNLINSPVRRSKIIPKIYKGEKMVEENIILKKQINDISKKLQQSDQANEMLRRTNETLRSKYDTYKKTYSKDKFVGVSRDPTSTLMLIDSPLMDSPGIKSHRFPSEEDKLNRNNSNNPNHDKNNNMKKEFINLKNISLSTFREVRNKIKASDNLNVSDDTQKKIVPSNNTEEQQAFIGIVQDNNNNLPSSTRQPLVKQSMFRINMPVNVNKSTNFEYKNDDLKRSLIEPFCFGDNAHVENMNEDITDEIVYNSIKSKCIKTIKEAHSFDIFSLGSFENYLFSTSNKSFKVWEMEKMKEVCEITACHTSSIHTNVKAIAINPNINIFATACDKLIFLWDLENYKNIGILKSGKGEIRCLYFKEDTLFSGGKGSTTNGAILKWDIRKLALLEEKEKAQEAFSIQCNQNTLYYGSRGHRIRRLSLEKEEAMESLPPYEPPHFDAVTSLSIYNDYLVSGDGYLKLWLLENWQGSTHLVSDALHTGWVNTLEINKKNNFLISGAKDGKMKIWNLSKNLRLRCLYDFGHSQSVNSICSLYGGYKACLASGSSDRSIKIWKIFTDEIGFHSESFIEGNVN